MPADHACLLQEITPIYTPPLVAHFFAVGGSASLWGLNTWLAGIHAGPAGGFWDHACLLQEITPIYTPPLVAHSFTVGGWAPLWGLNTWPASIPAGPMGLACGSCLPAAGITLYTPPLVALSFIAGCWGVIGWDLCFGWEGRRCAAVPDFARGLGTWAAWEVYVVSPMRAAPGLRFPVRNAPVIGLIPRRMASAYTPPLVALLILCV